jgi:hypothetical protein
MELSHFQKQHRWSAGLPHVAVIVLGIGGCASHNPNRGSANATVTTAVEQNCEQPGVILLTGAGGCWPTSAR